MKKIIILDFDGTTIDSMPFLESIAVPLISENYSISKELARKEYIRTTGLSFEQQINEIFPGNYLNNEVIAKFEAEKKARFFEQKPFPDAKETIDYLRERGYILAISSSTTFELISEYLKIHKLNFDAVLGYRPDFKKGKDHFDFLKNKFSLSKDEMIFVGDSIKDGERAFGYEIDFIAKTGLFTKDDFQRAFHNIIVINQLKEINESLLLLYEEKK